MMLRSHDRFHSENGRRQILVVDDEFINRELLGNVLQSEYEVLYAADGREGLKAAREHRDTLSLILLDLMMPEISGTEMLQRLKQDPDTARIPVIVLTSEQAAEVEILGLGAIDFIPKPYPQSAVILARVRRTIELSEDREIIRTTERDPLTGLYNREFFYRYAEQFDQHHRQMEMDAIVLDIHHFRMLNERFGTAYGDGILRDVGGRVRDLVADSGGIVCRREADTFLVYCPHRTDYETFLADVTAGLPDGGAQQSRVRLRMGVYSVVDKEIDIERRFDRAKIAADTVRNSVTRTVAIYDNALHDKELYEERLVEDFHRAIREEQFQVYYQPKFDVRPEIPFLTSAEALVRWVHPELGMISPGIFVPLFEDNGLVQELDIYVWEHAAAQIEDWKSRFGFIVPVSVNVSRIDILDPNLIGTLQRILSQRGLHPTEFLLEITESAYTQDSEQIIETVNRLRDLGFRIEMDDFGTGYSSLNMISKLPIDALKLDMQFIRNAFSQRRDTRMVEVIIDIADYLGVPVIAEGVETEDQLKALKSMGCDIVQGYYFSRPVPAEEYEQFMLERMRRDSSMADKRAMSRRAAEDRVRQATDLGLIAHALTSGFESIYYVDTKDNSYLEFTSEGRYEDLQIERSGEDFFSEIQRNIPRVIHPDDQARLSLSLAKETLLSQLVGSNPFSMTYRMMEDGRPVYYHLKAVRAGGHDKHHLVIGISNVDEQMRDAGGAAQDADPLNFSSLAQALSGDTECIYYVDTATDTYLRYGTGGDYARMGLEESGRQFFDECRRNVESAVYPDDRAKVAAVLEKKKLVAILGVQKSFSMDYRLLVGGEPVYYRMKVTSPTPHNLRHLIIGVSNVDAQITDAQKLEAARQSAATYSRIAQALATDYFSIYCVDTTDDSFIEYSENTEYTGLGIEKQGEDFFGKSRKNILRVVHPDDQEMVRSALNKAYMLEAMRETGSFTLTYRLMIGGEATYVHLKATRLGNESDPSIVIGVSNIDAQMKREQKHSQELRDAKEMILRDALTGVKSKTAFTAAETQWNEKLAASAAEPFAVAVCDVNSLKAVNDTLGHKAGDEIIRRACSLICNTFKHSPVYRIGGDEFAVILSGRDYERRQELLLEMDAQNRENVACGDVVIACGAADYEPGTDTGIEAVFERADAVMYENKAALKAAGL